MRRFVPICICLVLFSLLVQAQNWTGFRGNHASGVSIGHKTLTSWDAEKSTNVLWKTLIPGLSHASPVIWREKIFVITAISDDPNAFFQIKGELPEIKDSVKHTWKIYCLNKRNGKILWERTAHVGVPRVKRHAKATQANSSPVTDGRYVAALMGSEGLFCYDMNGKLLWKQDLGILNPGFWGDSTSEWGHSSSPIIYKDLVIVQADGHKQSFLAAYNLKDGKQAWRVERGEITSWSTPTIYEGKTRTELITNGGRFMRGYDPLTGKELWRFSDSDTQVKQQAPIIAQDLIILAGGWPRGRSMYAFRSGASGDISLKDGQDKNDFLAWRTDKGSPYTPTPIAYGEHLYVCTDEGIFRAYNLKSAEMIYQQRLPSSFTASPVAGDGKLYMASEDGEVFVVKAGPKFELLATNPMGEPLMATPAISEGVIYVRGQKFLYAIADKKATKTKNKN